MILKGSQRSGAGQLAAHLLNDNDNDHVTVHELRGYMADDLYGALAETYAISRGTRCRKAAPSEGSAPVDLDELRDRLLGQFLHRRRHHTSPAAQRLRQQQ